MCTYSPHYPALVAEHPIKCYKYMYKTTDGKYVTPYQLTYVEEGQMYHITDEQLECRQICVLENHELPYLLFDNETLERKYVEGETFFEIGKGYFHSFIEYSQCVDKFNQHKLDPIKQISEFEPAIAVCYIPVETKYFVGWYHISSSNLVISAPTSNTPWVQQAYDNSYFAQGEPDCYASETIFYAKIFDNLKEFYDHEKKNKMW